MRANAKRKARDSLIEECQAYVEFIAARLIKSLNLPAENLDEFIASGYLGLVEAAERYDPDSGVEFKHFAYLRIRGAIIDGIRNCSELSNRAYRYAKALQAAKEIQEAELHGSRSGNAAAPPALRKRFEKVLEYAAKGALSYRMSLCDLHNAPEIPEKGRSPEEHAALRQDRAIFRRIVAALPEKERIIVEGYYFGNKSFVEIARENAGMSKSWVSRLHARAIDRIKAAYLDLLNECGS